MAVNFQISFDCADAHVMSRFWSRALHWTIEDAHDTVRDLLDRGVVTDADVTTVDGRLAWREFAVIRDPRASADEHGLPVRGRMLFQVVPEPKTAKNRMHLDVHPHAGDRDAEVARLLDLGATKLWDGKYGRHTWVTLADPEGNEFCVA